MLPRGIIGDLRRLLNFLQPSTGGYIDVGRIHANIRQLNLPMTAEWKHAIGLSEIPQNGIAECVIDGRIIALFTVDGIIQAVDGICPHQGGSLAKGSLHDCIIRCPWHGWEYDVHTGQHQSIPAVCIDTFEARIVDGRVEVQLP